MKNLFNQVVILCLAVCSLLTFASCNNPADEFAGEYEISGSPYIQYYIPLPDELDGGDASVEKAPDELIFDANLIKATDDSIAMVGTKIKLTSKDVLFCDSNVKFNIESYQFFKSNNSGQYILKTDDKKLIIHIVTDKEESNSKRIKVGVREYVTALDEKEYRCDIIISFKIGETK